MNKYVHDIVQYIWLPFMLGFVLYVFQSQHDPALAIVLLIAFSALYTLIRIYFASKKWWFLAASVLVIIGVLGFYFLRPQGISLSINGQHVTSSSISFNEGSVSVYPAPGGDGKYAEGTLVSLTASPGAGYDLKSWKGTSNDIANPTTIILSRRQEVTVTFKPRSSLIINNQPVIGAIVSFSEGSVSVDPPPEPEKDNKYTRDTVVHLTANPNPGFDWSSWAGTDGNSSNPTTVTMDSNKQVTVSFQPRFSLIISNEIAVGSILNFNEGSILLNPPPGDDDKYARGTVVTLTANPDSGYGLKNWSGTIADSSNPTTVTINSDKHVSVTFELRFPLIVNSITVGGPTANFTEGTVSVNPPPLADGRYAKDKTITLIARPAAGYRFDHWNGDASGNTADFTLTMSSAKNITAVFIRQYNITTSVSPAGSGNISASPASGPYDTGSPVTLTASPTPGYRFDRWTGDLVNAASVTVTMNDNKNVTAVFKKIYTLTTSVTPTGSGTITTSGGSYEEGTVITLNALPATGYTFDHWGGDASGNTTATANMTASRNIIAVFNKVTVP